MEIKNKIFMNQEITQSLIELKEMDLPMKECFKAIQLFKKIGEIEKDFYEAKNKILQKCGKPSKDNKNRYEIEDTETFEKDMNELLEITTNVPIEKIKISEDNKVTPKFLMSLEDFIEIQ